MAGGGQITPVRLPWNDARFESDPPGRQGWRAAWTRLEGLARSLEELESKLAEARAAGDCLLSLGSGGGLLAKSAWLDTGQAEYREVLRNLSLYATR